VLDETVEGAGVDVIGDVDEGQVGVGILIALVGLAELAELVELVKLPRVEPMLG
jgi:hypothetical protein